MNQSKLKLRISTLLDKKGFGIAETLVSIGIVGVLITAVISQQKVSTKSIATVASDTTINDIMRMTIGEVSDQATCTRNFGTKQKNQTHPQLVNNGSGQPFLVAGNTYGVGGSIAEGNKTVVGEILLSEIETLASVPANPYAMILRLKFKRKDVGGVFTLSPTITRDIALNTVMDPGNPTIVSTCFGDFNLLAQSAVRASCLQERAETPTLKWAARYEEPSALHPYGRCIHNPGDITCPNGTFLQKVDAANGVPTYECNTLSSSCLISGQYIKGFKDDGTFDCDYPVPRCAAGEFIVKASSGQYVCEKVDCTDQPVVSAFAGFNLTTGKKICTPISTASNCSAGSISTAVTSSGSVTCSEVKVVPRACPEGERINSIDVNGNPICTKFITLPINCGAGYALRSIDANGNPVCEEIHRPLRCGTSSTTHSNIDCRLAGGTAYNVGNSALSQCVFNTSCPGGWTRCDKWGSQQDASCFDTSNTDYCDSRRLTRVADGGNGSQVNRDLVSVQCKRWMGYPNTSRSCTETPGVTVTTTQLTVGCY